MTTRFAHLPYLNSHLLKYVWYVCIPSIVFALLLQLPPFQGSNPGSRSAHSPLLPAAVCVHIKEAAETVRSVEFLGCQTPRSIVRLHALLYLFLARPPT